MFCLMLEKKEGGRRAEENEVNFSESMKLNQIYQAIFDPSITDKIKINAI